MATDFIFPPIATGVLLVVTALLADRASERWRPYCWALFICLVATVVGFDIHEKVSNRSEAETLNGRIDKLGGELQQSETQRQLDTAVLSTKLSDYAQFGPAIMKLATTSAEYQKRQFEEKVVTDKDLYRSTIDVVKRIRELSVKYSQAESSVSMAQMQLPTNATEEQRHQAWQASTNQLIQLSFNERAEFQGLMPDILYVRNSLLARKMAEPKLSPMEQSMVDSALHAGMGGSFQENAIATYLELMAKPLVTK